MESLIKFLMSPPGWIVFLLISIVVSHSINPAKILPGLLEGQRSETKPILLLEIIATLVLATITLHKFYEPNLSGEHHSGISPIFFLFVFLFYTFLSIGIYILAVILINKHLSD